MSKIIYCQKCKKRMPHKLVGHESIAEGTGIARVFLAVASLGLSETASADWYYQCTKCGEITKR